MEMPKRKINRLSDYDYSTPNAYFITICTQNRRNLFWNHVGAANGRPYKLSLCGSIVDFAIQSIPKHYPSISVDKYVVMPNHVHLLLLINSDSDGRPMAAPTISTVVNQMKGSVSKQIGEAVWQKGFYDHIIRGEADYLEIWNYIEGNPSNWIKDDLFTEDAGGL